MSSHSVYNIRTYVFVCNGLFEDITVVIIQVILIVSIVMYVQQYTIIIVFQI